MFKEKIKPLFILATLLILISIPSHVQKKQKEGIILSKREISLNNRQSDRFINNIFKDNILLTLSYMDGKISPEKQIDWEKVRKEESFEIRLDSNETFAFHEDVLPEHKNKISKGIGKK